jgi:MerR family transcriptional regulator/heat shock protein HspR
VQENRDPKEAIYVMSVAAALAGVHPQTLRIYERKGLVNPARVHNRRRYSEYDIERIRLIQELTQVGVNLAGVKMVLDLQDNLEGMQERMLRMEREMEETALAMQAEMEALRRGLRNEIVHVPRSELMHPKDLLDIFPFRRRG